MQADIEAQVESINPDALKLALSGTLQAMQEVNDPDTLAAREALASTIESFGIISNYMD